MFIGQIWQYQSKGMYRETTKLLVIFKATNPTQVADTVAVVNWSTTNLANLVKLGLKISLVPTVEVSYTQIKPKLAKMTEINPQLCHKLGIG